jgi:hypothetical protein
MGDLQAWDMPDPYYEGKLIEDHLSMLDPLEEAIRNTPPEKILVISLARGYGKTALLEKLHKTPEGVEFIQFVEEPMEHPVTAPVARIHRERFAVIGSSGIGMALAAAMLSEKFEEAQLKIKPIPIVLPEIPKSVSVANYSGPTKSKKHKTKTHINKSHNWK